MSCALRWTFAEKVANTHIGQHLVAVSMGSLCFVQDFCLLNQITCHKYEPPPESPLLYTYAITFYKHTSYTCPGYVFEFVDHFCVQGVKEKIQEALRSNRAKDRRHDLE